MYKKQGIFGLAFLAASFITPAFAQQSGYFINLPDVPMMPGMKEAAGAPGQQAVAVVAGRQNEVLSFYDQKLVSEGWTTTDAHHMLYKKDDKTLTLNASTATEQTTVTFTETSSAPPPAPQGTPQPAPNPDTGTSAPPDQQQPPAYSQ